MKKTATFIAAMLISGLTFAQRLEVPSEPGGTGLNSLQNSNGGGRQPGSEQNPYNELYVNDFLKIGTNSLWLTSAPQTVGGTPGVLNRMFSTSGPLYINGVHPVNGLIPASIGENTLINANKGSVGIGTISPNAKLDINLGTDYLSRTSGVRIIAPQYFLTDGPSDNNNISLFEVRRIENGSTGTITHTPFIITNNRDASNANVVNNNIGIGIDKPRTKLHVHDGRIHITGNNSAGGPMITFGGTATNSPAGTWGIEYIASGVAGLNFWKPFPSNNWGNYFMFLADNGKVSIGLDPNNPNNFPSQTYAGNYKLYVADGILTERVKVALRSSADWADYVFKPEYKLLKLNDVETYIKENGHLPNVPSAEEVANTGIDMAKMDAKLLEKIEELTLYMIELKKDNDLLKAKVSELEQTINK